MKERFIAVRDVLKAAIDGFNEDRVPRLAAALSYYIAFSIAPLMIVMITVVNHLIALHAGASSEHDVRAQLVARLSEAVGGDAARAINTFMTAATAQKHVGVIANIVSWGVVLFGAMGLFGALQDALNTIFDAKSKLTGFWAVVRDRATSLLMVVLVIALFGLASIAQHAVDRAGELVHLLPSTVPEVVAFFAITGWFFSLVALTVLFVLIYRILPDVEMPVKSIVRGAAITTLLFFAGEFAINLYIQHIATTSTYGAVGSLVVLLLWLNYSMQTVLFGAELTKVLDRRDRELDAAAKNAPTPAEPA